jgi:hypothetical protein
MTLADVRLAIQNSPGERTHNLNPHLNPNLNLEPLADVHLAIPHLPESTDWQQMRQARKTKVKCVVCVCVCVRVCVRACVFVYKAASPR